MFGYVTVNQPELKIREYQRYRGFYCGLCRSLMKNYGISSRMSLSYDMTFLLILLSSLYEPQTQEQFTRCAFHPARKHLELHNPFSDFAADMNLLSAWYLTEDRILDSDNHIEQLTGSSLALLYRKSFKQLKQKYPGKVKRIEKNLEQLHKLEAENCTDLDLVCGLSGEIVSEFFTPFQDEWSGELSETGFYLGKFISLMDAWEDVEKDLARKQYNPLIPLFHQLSPDLFEQRCHHYMTMLMADCAAHFERLPLVQDIEILRNIIYSGVWTRYELISARRSSQKEKK